MSEAKRRPGRPKGSEKDDSAPLMAMAYLITDHPGLPPKTAARRVFRGGTWGCLTEDSALHRWQGKWKTSGADYLQRVQVERVAAEAERQRRERAAAEARERSRKPWPEIAAELRAAGQMPGWATSGTAFDAFAQHREAMREISSPRDGLSAYRSAAGVAAGYLPDLGTLTGYRAPAALAAGHLTAFEMFAQVRQPGSALYEAMQAQRSILDNLCPAEAMQKYDGMGRALREAGEIGRTLADASMLARLSKLPTGF